jgi:hypothetical protein
MTNEQNSLKVYLMLIFYNPYTKVRNYEKEGKEGYNKA